MSSDSAPANGPNLPVGMANHCFVSLNATTAFLVHQSESYYFDKVLIQWQLNSDEKLFSQILLIDYDLDYKCSTVIPSKKKKEVWIVIAGDCISLSYKSY